jgi:DNA-binding NarL/FixJ family response regulator
MISVVVADDQSAVRDGLITILELADGITVTAGVSDGAQAVDAVTAHEPDVLLLDLQMPEVSGMEVIRSIVEFDCKTRILILTTYGDDDSIACALAAGANGYITKADGAAQIVAAVRSVAARQSPFGTDATQFLLRGLRTRRITESAARRYGLTEQEARVLHLIAAGLRNRDIAAELVVSMSTVKTQINNLFTKMGVTSRLEAAQRASASGPHW